ncbi:MAG: rod-binding protein [Pseudomonadota bacterium]|jgi:flagellar protein FlgJ
MSMIASPAVNIAGLGGIAGGTGARRPATAEEAAKAYEAIFIAQMLSQMFSGLSVDGPFGGGSSEELYRSLMIEEYGVAMVQRGGIGVADALQREMLKFQEVA